MHYEIIHKKVSLNFINCSTKKQVEKVMQMKKIIYFSSLLLLFLLNSLKAQTFRAGFTLGATATCVNSMDSRDGDNDMNKLGYVLGGIVNSKLNKKNELQLEMNYIKKGTLQKPDSMNMNSYRLSLDYIEVPIMLRHHMHFNIGKKIMDKFDWEAGASVGIMVRHIWVVDGYQENFDQSKINKIDASIFVGFDYNFSSTFYISFRYSNSVIPAVKHDFIPGYLIPYDFNTGNNMVFQMSLKFVFGGTAEKESTPA